MCEVFHPILPQGISLIDCRKQPERSQHHLQRVLLTEGGEGGCSCPLPTVQETVSYDLGKDSWPLGVERVLQDRHHHCTPLHTHLYEVKALVQRRVVIPRCAKHLPQQAGHAILVQASQVNVALLIYKHRVHHLPKDRRINDKLDRMII